MNDSIVKDRPDNGGDLAEDDRLDWLIDGADELRKGLGLGERGFNFMSRAHNLRGRQHYIYSILDEIEQVALALKISQEQFEGGCQETSEDEVEQRLLRNTFTVVEREQALHIRRLTEILVDLINFSKTNSNVYYDHYLLYQELGEHKKRKLDFDLYFNCKNLNTQTSIDFAKRSIGEAEKKLQLTDCRYLAGKSPKPNGDSEMATFKARFDNALPLASKAERLVLGLYYGQAYREPSQSIHLNIGGLRSEVLWETLMSRRGQIWLRATHCLTRCRRLLNVRSRNSVVAGLSKAIKEYTKSTNVQYSQPSIARGDFVSVFGTLAEVTSSCNGKFGYKCFKLRFFSAACIYKDDWYPGIYVRKQFDGHKMRLGILARLSVDGIPARVKPRALRQAMRKTILELWEQVQEAARKSGQP